PVSLAGAAVVVGFGLLAMVLLVRSLPWPLIQDAPVMHYIAWRIGEGDVPYRDLYDINQPGVYVLHLALLRTLGAGDGAWRAFDLAWLAAPARSVCSCSSRPCAGAARAARCARSACTSRLRRPCPPRSRSGWPSPERFARGRTSSSVTRCPSTVTSAARRPGSVIAGSAGF